MAGKERRRGKKRWLAYFGGGTRPPSTRHTPIHFARPQGADYVFRARNFLGEERGSKRGKKWGKKRQSSAQSHRVERQSSRKIDQATLGKSVPRCSNMPARRKKRKGGKGREREGRTRISSVSPILSPISSSGPESSSSSHAWWLMRGKREEKGKGGGGQGASDPRLRRLGAFY